MRVLVNFEQKLIIFKLKNVKIFQFVQYILRTRTHDHDYDAYEIFAVLNFSLVSLGGAN